jgi:hypothetical protein
VEKGIQEQKYENEITTNAEINSGRAKQFNNIIIYFLKSLFFFISDVNMLITVDF